MARSGKRRKAALVVALMLGSVGCMRSALATEPDAAQPQSLAVYALSRGKGVPEATRRAFGEIKAKLQSLHDSAAVVELKEQLIGIEGETRLCAVFVDPRAAREEYQRLARYQSVDLLNIVLESCDDTK
jgi:hypothetical protein